MNRAAPSEAVGMITARVDDAYVAALHGDPSYIDFVGNSYYERAIRATTQPDQRAPRETDVADAVWRGITLPELHMLAEMLDGRQHRTTKAAHKTATAVGALTFLPEVVASLGSRVTANRPVASMVAEGLGTIVAIPRMAAEGLARRGMNHLEGAAHALIKHLYEVHYHTATDLAPYVWATLLSRLSHRRNIDHRVLDTLAGRFLNSYLVSADMRSPEHTPRSLRAMYVYLRDRHPTHVAIRVFEDRENEARQTRARGMREHFTPPPTTQPRGDAMRRLRESSEEYQFFVGHPYHALEARMRRVAQEVNGNEPGSLQEMAAVMSAVIERAQLTEDPDREAFAQLLGQCREKYGDLLRDMLIDSIRDITAGRASVGVLRLADSFVRQPSLWDGWAYVDDVDRLYRAIESAAFKWYEQPRDVYGQNWPFRQMLYAAYVHRRTHLGAPTRDLALAKQRAWGLLRTLPNRRTLRHQVERDVPQIVQAEIASARQVLKIKAKAAA